jgi:ribonuclease HII
MESFFSFLSGFGVTADRVVGIDEAGRGPLAGPVCVAGVVLLKDHGIVGLDDSKKLTEKKRRELFNQITSASEYWVQFGSASLIDRNGILNVTKRLMRRIVIDSHPDFILTDAVGLNVMDVPQLALPKGDARVDCIAAASIVAKVVRDRLMTEYDTKYPGYRFVEHKGYGTEVHRKAIRELGPSKIHRMSFDLGLGETNI